MYNKCGWYIFTHNSTLYSSPPMKNTEAAYSNTGNLVSGAKVTVKLDIDKKTIAYNINGTDCGIAYNNISTDKELCLCIQMADPNDYVEIVS